MFATKQFKTLGFLFVIQLSIGLVLFLSTNIKEEKPNIDENKSYLFKFLSKVDEIKHKTFGYKALKVLNISESGEQLESILTKEQNKEMEEEKDKKRIEEEKTEKDKEENQNIIEERNAKDDEIKREDEKKQIIEEKTRKEEEKKMIEFKRKEEEIKKKEEDLKRKEAEIKREKERKQKEEEKMRRIKEEKERAYEKEINKWEKRINEIENRLEEITNSDITEQDKYYEIRYQLKTFTGHKKDTDKFDDYRDEHSLNKDPCGMWCSNVKEGVQFDVALQNSIVKELYFPFVPSTQCRARKIIDCNNQEHLVTSGEKIHVPFECQGNQFTITAYEGNGTHICLPEFRVIGKNV